MKSAVVTPTHAVASHLRSINKMVNSATSVRWLMVEKAQIQHIEYDAPKWGEWAGLKKYWTSGCTLWVGSGKANGIWGKGVVPGCPEEGRVSNICRHHQKYFSMCHTTAMVQHTRTIDPMASWNVHECFRLPICCSVRAASG
mgnify:CR=1 FL=1|eukprot:scaffold92334_cov30-Tisochrysis_lutea.AAC.4